MSISNENTEIKRMSKGIYSSDVLLVKEDLSFMHDDKVSDDSLQETKEHKYAENVKKEEKKNENLVCNKRYCSKCGSVVDNKTKKCTGCGKQYLNTKKCVKYIGIIVVILALVLLLMVNIQNKKELDSYKEQLKNEQIERVKSNNPDNRISYDVSKIRIVEDGYAEAGLFSEMISDTKYLIHSNNLGDTFEVEYKVIGGMKVGSTNYSLEGDGTLSVASVKYEKAKDCWYKVTLPDGKEGYIWGGTDGIYVEEIEMDYRD